MDLEHERRLASVEARSQSNTHRIDELEKRQDNLDKLVSTVEVLAVKESNVENDVKEMKNDIKTLIAKPGKRWEGVVEKMINAVVGGIIAYILIQIGF